MQGQLLEAGDVSFDDGASGEIGEDEREAVTDVTSSPWRHVCALRALAADGETTLLGTGWLIGRRVVVTAAHCLFVRPSAAADPALAGEVRSVEVIPALSGDQRPYGAAISTRFRVPEGWRGSLGAPGQDAADLDYGVIFLDGEGFPHAGSFSFGVAPETVLRARPLDIAGYPYHKADSTPDEDDLGKVLYHHRPGKDDGLIAVAEPFQREGRLMLYNVDTSPGQSGAPILIDVQGKAVAIGIHTTGYRSQYSNSGRRIDDELFAWLVARKKENQ